MNSVTQVMKELKKCGSEQTRRIYARHGAGDNVFGVKAADLKVIATKLEYVHHPHDAIDSFVFDLIHFIPMSRPCGLSEATQGTAYSEIHSHVADLAQSSNCFLDICFPSATSPARYIAS